MSKVTKVEMVYKQGGGATLDSQFSNEVDELLLASMLIETIAVRHGWTVEETAEIILGSIDDREPMNFKIFRSYDLEGAE